jgi:hypothetical protein
MNINMLNGPTHCSLPTKLANACHHPVQNLSFSRLLSKKLKLLYTKIISSVVLYECETWSLTLRDEHRHGNVWGSSFANRHKFVSTANQQAFPFCGYFLHLTQYHLTLQASNCITDERGIGNKIEENCNSLLSRKALKKAMKTLSYYSQRPGPEENCRSLLPLGNLPGTRRVIASFSRVTNLTI